MKAPPAGLRLRKLCWRLVTLPLPSLLPLPSVPSVERVPAAGPARA